MCVSHPFRAIVDFATPLTTGSERTRYGFAHPVQVLQAHNGPELHALLQAVQAWAQQGYWCVGGLRYEAASALQPQLVTAAAADGPLAWFAVFAEAQLAPALPVSPLPTLHWQSPVQRAHFEAQMAQIHEDIACGAYYQVNYTQQLQARSQQPVDGLALFAALQQAQPGGYALYVDMGQECIASVSPELFFDWHQPAQGLGRILTRPMKGTATRGATAAWDAQQAQQLRDSVKERAENVMIVDLLRNDLGRIAVTGSVQVPALFAVQALPTVWQMTSDVQAVLPQGTDLRTVMQALFPCGSVTGAPKRAAMQAIAALEAQPRGWYCGALGMVRSDGAGGIRATWNVPIRTVVVQSQPDGAQLYCGIGSGVTAQAHADGEWQEWRAKQAFVERVSQPFELLTTLALEEGHLRHEAWHVQRLQDAAVHFGFAWSKQALPTTLAQIRQTHPAGLWRVRIAWQRDGQCTWHAQPMTTETGPVRLRLAARPMPEAHSEFVRFKTTRRSHYERFSPASDVLDTVLWNEDGAITEGTRGNVAALMDGQWVTPALSCGLLNGVGRQVALAQGRMVEGVITLQDLPRVQQWAFINSLRGWLPAQLLPAENSETDGEPMRAIPG